MTMPAADGQTKVDSGNACHVAIAAPVNDTAYRLNSNPDTVQMPYDVSWFDERPNPPQPRATHTFTLQTEHLGNIQSDSKTVDTFGDDSGSDTLSLDVPNVYSGQSVNITFSASVSVPLVCSASDSITLSYQYTYP